MVLRFLALAAVIAAAGCSQQPQPKIQIGQPTAEGLAIAQSYCSNADFYSDDPANPPDEWYLCP